MNRANRAPDLAFFPSFPFPSCPTTSRSARKRQTGPIETTMNLNLSLTPLISLLAGILILAMPRLLNYIVAIYLIIVGLIGLFGVTGMRLS